ncbi:MAG: ketosteroid isomerase [Propionibacteriales bacterium]|nr:ketosteroid isomerase [Propionibacteriales bacterium]
MMQDTHEDRIRSLYVAFNARDIETVLAAMKPDVDWENGWKGGRLIGRASVRDYWERQWAAIDPHVEPTGMTVRPSGEIVVDVHQVVRDERGDVVAEDDVRHVFVFDTTLVQRMDIEG